MINFPVSLEVFLKDYWQKKPLIIRQAFNDFENPLTADELAGLALEEDVESRLVCETPGAIPQWQLKRGPLDAEEFSSLPATHWTLLVQGVDRFVPEVALLFENFKFIPQWRIDDVMISYAVTHGSVGPHYDHYDVFLYQASGSRKWTLTMQNCTPENYLENLELRIMKEFIVEEEFILEPGDMVYLPPHVGHYGVSLSDDCMTYSFGYRSYRGQELLDSFTEYLAEHSVWNPLYKDPEWTINQSSVLVPQQAWLNAQEILRQALDDETIVKHWFASYVTTLDSEAEQLLPEAEENSNVLNFTKEMEGYTGLIWDSVCRKAYLDSPLQLFINGVEWDITDVEPELVKYVANEKILFTNELVKFFDKSTNVQLIYKLYELQWLQWLQLFE